MDSRSPQNVERGSGNHLPEPRSLRPPARTVDATRNPCQTGTTSAAVRRGYGRGGDTPIRASSSSNRLRLTLSRTPLRSRTA